MWMVSGAHAQTVSSDNQYTWQNSAGNFSTGFTPTLNSTSSPFGDSNGELNFGGTAAYLATNDIGTININALVSTNTGLTNIASGTLALTTNSAGLLPDLYVGSGGMTLNSTTTVTGSSGFVENGTGNLTIAGTDTLTGSAIINGGTLTLNSAPSSSLAIVLNNGAALSLSSSQALTATNIVYANSGTASFSTADATLSATFAGNGNLNWTESVTITGPNYGGTGSTFSNFGGTISFQNNNGIRIIASTTNTNSLNPFANFNLGAGSAAFYCRNGTEDIVLGGIQSTGTGAGIGGATNSGGHDILWIVGSANVPTETLAGGVFLSGQAANAFLKTGTGTLVMTGISTSTDTAGTGGAAYQTPGAYNFYGGILQLNFSANTSNLLPSGVEVAIGQGGTLALVGNGSASSTQTFGGLGTTLSTGGGAITLNANGSANTLTLNLGALNIGNAGAALNVTTGGAGTDVLTTTTAKLTDGTYGARVTYGSGFATTVSTASPYTLSTYTPGSTLSGSGDSAATNYALSGSGTVSAADSANSLTISSATGSAQSLALNGNLTLTNGGLLYNGSDAYSITGASTLQSNTATNSELIIQQLGTGNLSIGAVIANGVGASILTKAGPGTLVLSGTNTFTGATYLNGGITSITSDANLGAVATGANVNLYGGTLQANASIGLYNGTAGTNNRNIVIGGGGGTIDVTSGNTFTVAGVISDTSTGTVGSSLYGSLTKTDSGTLVLTNTSNTYFGATVIDGGILSVNTLASGNTVSSIGQSPATANALILNGGTLQYTGVATTTNRTFTVGVNGATLDASGSGALNFNSSAPVVASGAIAGSGTRTLTLTGGYDGGSAAATNILAAQIVDGTGPTSVVKAGAGSWTLTNTHTYTGTTTVSQGTLYLANSSSSNPISASTSIAVGTGAFLNVAGLSGGGITLSGAQTLTGAGTVTGAVSAASGSSIEPGTVASGLAGAGTLTVGNLNLAAGSIGVFGLSSANLDGANTTGASILAAQALSLPASGKVTVQLYQPNMTSAFATAGTYDLITATNIASIASSVASDFTIGSATDNSAFSYTFGTNASDTDITVTLTQNATAGVWQLNGNGVWNTSVTANWTGGVPHSAGDTATFGTDGGTITVSPVVTLSQNQSVGGMAFSSPLSYTLNSSGGTLTFDNKGAGASLAVSAGTANLINAPVALNDSLAITVNAGASLSIAGNITNTTGAQAITFNGNGTLALSGSNTYGPAAGATGTTIAGTGTLQVGSNGALGAGDLSFAANGTLQSGATGLSLANNINIGAGLTASLDSQANTLVLTGVIGDGGSGTGSINKVGSGTVVLDNNETFGGSTTISAGTLQLGNADSTGSVPGNIVDNATLSINRVDSPTISNIISGTGNLVQSGASNVTLNGSNTFTGNTAINAGSIVLGNALALQNSTLNYNNQGGNLSFGSLTAATLGGLTGSQPLALLNTGATAVTLTVGNNNASTTYSGAMNGTGGALVKVGNGTFTLSGVNTYSGSTSVNAGSLVLTSTGAIGSGLTPASAGGISFGDNANGTLGGNINASSFTTNSNGTSTVTITGGNVNISGTLSVDNDGGNNQGLLAITGGTVTAGTVLVSRTAQNYGSGVVTAGITTQGIYINGGNLVSTGTMYVGSTSTKDNSSANVRIDAGTINVTGTTIITTNDTRTAVFDVNGGTFNNPGGIQIGGVFGTCNAEWLVRGGVSTVSGISFGDATQSNGANYLEMLGGTVFVGAGGMAVNPAAIFPVTPTINLGGTAYATAPTLAATAPWSSSLLMTLTNSSSGLAPIIQTADSTGAAQNITLTGQLEGTGGLTKTGAGTLFLATPSGTGSGYFGVTSINAGTLNINSQWAIGGADSGGVTFNGGTLQFAAGGPVNGNYDITFNGSSAVPITVAAGGGTIDLNGNNVAFAQSVGNNGTGALTLTDTSGSNSSLTLNALATYTGATNIIGGAKLIAGAANVLATGSAFNVANGTLDASVGNQSIGALVMGANGTLNLSFGSVLAVTNSASFGGFLNLAGTAGTLPETLVSYNSGSGTFPTANVTGIPSGDELYYGVKQLLLAPLGYSQGPSTLIWSNAAGNNTWNSSSLNWNSGSGTVAYSDNSNARTGDIVVFNDSAPAGGYNVTINNSGGSVHPTSVTFSNSANNYNINGAGVGIAGPGSVTLTGTGTVTMNATNTYTGGTNVSAGKLVIASATSYPNNGSTGTALTVGAGAVFQIAPHSGGSSYEPIVNSLANGGLIDITNNEMLFPGGTLTTIAGEVSAAHNTNGSWKTAGNGLITSSTVSGLTTVGVGIVGGVVEVKATYYGDANLDGQVTSADYTLIDAGFLSHGASTGWQNGDFNYDGVINGSDYTLIDNAFNTQGAQLSTEIASATAQVAGGGTSSAVPEPASLGLIGMGALGLLGRRNRRRH